MLRAEVSGFVLNIFFEILCFNLANQRKFAFSKFPKLKSGVIYFSSSIPIKINSVGLQPNANILIANLFFLRNIRAAATQLSFSSPILGYRRGTAMRLVFFVPKQLVQFSVLFSP